jgi:hypothetical protein
MPGPKTVTLVVAAQEGKLRIPLSIENARRHPLVAVRRVHLRMEPAREGFRLADDQTPHPARGLAEVRVFSVVLQQDLGASLQRFAVAVVDADLAVCDAALGDEESQQPGHVLVDPHPRALRQVHQRHSIADGKVLGRRHHAAVRARDHDRVLARHLNDAAARHEATHTVSGAKRMAGEVNIFDDDVSPDGHRMATISHRTEPSSKS